MILTIAALAAGIGVGIVAGALGIGGGILAIPVLVYLLHQDPVVATAESLVIVIVTSAAALPSRFKHNQVRLSTGVLFGICSAIGALIGTQLNAMVDGNIMMYSFAVLLCAVAAFMGYKGMNSRRAENAQIAANIDISDVDNEDTSAEKPVTVQKIPQLILVGTFTGALVGFFGIGGGFMMIPVLVAVMGYSMRVAAGTSFIYITVVSLISLAMRFIVPAAGDIVGQIDWLVAAFFAIGSGIGSAIGSPLSNKARQSTLTFIFCGLLVAVAIYTVLATALGLHA